MATEQNFKTHAKFDPLFHFVAAPILLANFVLSIYITIRDWPLHSRSHLWWIVLSVAWLVTAALARSYSLAQQDRIIRLEERLRYLSLLPQPALTHSASLTLRQMIALRFASDAELPALIDRAVADNLTGKQIKESIRSWRADHQRI